MEQQLSFTEFREKRREPTQKDKILKLFDDGDWHSNFEMNEICFRYGARIFELQQEGWLFEKRHDGGSKWSWKLVGRYGE